MAWQPFYTPPAFQPPSAGEGNPLAGLTGNGRCVAYLTMPRLMCASVSFRGATMAAFCAIDIELMHSTMGAPVTEIMMTAISGAYPDAVRPHLITFESFLGDLRLL